MLVRVVIFVLSTRSVLGIHYPDNGDGTYSNPVMPSGHWSDPSIVRVENSYYVVVSSIETTPQLQILHSTDLVNWDVVGSVLRHCTLANTRSNNWCCTAATAIVEPTAHAPERQIPCNVAL